MHPRIIAERNAAAQERIVAAVTQLAEKLGLETQPIAAINTSYRDPLLMILFQREALADVLESLVAHVKPPEAGQQLPLVPPSGGKDKKAR